jgi:HEAT repeat protein
MPQTIFAELLANGDMRTTGRAPEVAELVTQNPGRAEELVDCLTHENPGVRMRAADALQKAAAQDQNLIQPFKERILTIAEDSTQQEVQWHCAQMLRILELSQKEAERARKTMLRYLEFSKSAIVKAEAIETLAHLAIHNAQWLNPTQKLIEGAAKNGRGAVAARGRKALKFLQKHAG